MALGAMEQYGRPVTLVPAGFNYYNPDRFRSKVIIEYGPAYTIPQSILDLYKMDRNKGINELMTQVRIVSLFHNLRCFKLLLLPAQASKNSPPYFCAGTSILSTWIKIWLPNRSFPSTAAFPKGFKNSWKSPSCKIYTKNWKTSTNSSKCIGFLSENKWRSSP